MKDDAFYQLGLRVLSRLPAGPLGRVVVITSARDGEGKTLVAQGLARALAAQCSGPVALVACATDRAAATTAGWSDLIETGQWTDGLAKAGAAGEGPDLMGAGTRMRTETLFKPDAVDAALGLLRQRYAMTVVDAPSLAACGALPRQTDGTLLVVNARDTRREVVQGALAAHPVPTERLLGTVLNQRPAYVPNWLYRWML